MLTSIFRRMPLVLLVLIAIIMMVGSFIPLAVKQSIYGVSVSIKSLIVTLLPVIIFGLLFRASVTMAGRATWIIAAVLVAVTLSTFAAVFLARWVGIGLYQMNFSMGLPPTIDPLLPLFSWQASAWVPNEWVMMAAVSLGISGAVMVPRQAEQCAQMLDRLVASSLALISFLIPLFVSGFAIKLQHEGVMAIVLQNYALVFGLIAASKFVYLFLMYFLASGGALRQTWESFKSMVPAGISGFSTMSSAATLPLIIQGVQRNTCHTQMAPIVVPLLVNIHMVGECFTDVILAYAVIKTYGVAVPTLMEFCIFAGYFMLARFSVAAIPGGGILVMYPLLQTFFHFNSEMMSLTTALYILFDPVITAANVLGDGALAQGLDRLVTRFPWLAYSRKEIHAGRHLRS